MKLTRNDRRLVQTHLDLPVGAPTRPHKYGDLFGDEPAPPDYGPMAASSDRAAEMGLTLGREQMAEGKRQYEQNMEMARRVVDQQLGIADETAAQGRDYYEYMKANQRPVEMALNREAMAAGSEAEQERRAGMAGAAFNASQKGQQGALIRQGLRYGFSPGRMAATGGSQASTSALQRAQGMNTARELERTTGFAKKMDVAGLYRGLPGASAGAYGLAGNMGNAALNNQMAPGGAYLQALNQGAGTTFQGLSLGMQGQSAVMNSQAQYAQAQSQQGSPFGQLIGMGLGAYMGSPAGGAAVGKLFS